MKTGGGEGIKRNRARLKRAEPVSRFPGSLSPARPGDRSPAGEWQGGRTAATPATAPAPRRAAPPPTLPSPLPGPRSRGRGPPGRTAARRRLRTTTRLPGSRGRAARRLPAEGARRGQRGAAPCGSLASGERVYLGGSGGTRLPSPSPDAGRLP